MHSTRRLQEIARDSSFLMRKADYSAEKPHPKTSMGPPPPVTSVHPLQPSALHKNSNLHRPFQHFSPLSHGHNNLHKKQKTTHNSTRISYNGAKATPLGRVPQPESREISLASILKRTRPYYTSATDSARESVRKERSEFAPRYKRRKVTIANPLLEEYKGTFISPIV